MINKATIDLIKSFEGLRLKAYVDPATGGEPITIGYGTTIYNGIQKVKMGETITEPQAEQFLLYDVKKFSEKVKALVKKELNENQFGALVSFSYNVGVGNLKTSKLLAKLNTNPNDISLRDEFLKWNRAAGKVMAGLDRRRKAESKLYFT